MNYKPEQVEPGTFLGSIIISIHINRSGIPCWRLELGSGSKHIKGNHFEFDINKEAPKPFDACVRFLDDVLRFLHVYGMRK